ncbi:hypothetical protein [Kribbella sp. NPDC051620]|uniref:hypothetical protein n=1 Tax=Kribbella sp. NPDC051620 TaxID=3364120 RepID=UPI0037AE4335
MADSIRDFLPTLRRQLGMYVPRASFITTCAFLAGYRWGSDDEMLANFHPWLVARGRGRSELGWPWLVLCEIYPQDQLPEPLLFNDEQDAVAVDLLFNLLDDYFAAEALANDAGER